MVEIEVQTKAFVAVACNVALSREAVMRETRAILTINRAISRKADALTLQLLLAFFVGPQATKAMSVPGSQEQIPAEYAVSVIHEEIVLSDQNRAIQ